MRLLLMWMSCAAAAAAGEPSNLVRNGGFELVSKQNPRLPAGWRFAWKYTHSSDRSLGYEKQEPAWGLDAAGAKVGRRCFHIRVTRRGDDGVLSQENLPAPTGVKTYLVKAWIRAARMKGAAANVALVALGPKGKWLGANYSVISVREDRDWTEFAGYFAAPPRTQKLRLRLWLNFSYSGTGEAWFDDVRVFPTDLKEKPPIRYVDDTPEPALRPHEARAGYRLFSRSYLEMVFPVSKPRAEELDAPLVVAAARGESEPLSFCVRAVKALQRVRIEMSDLVGPAGARIPAARVEIGVVRCLYRRGQARWGPFKDGRMLTPIYIAPAAAFDLAAGETRQVWATLHAPADARPGRYAGRVTVRPANAPARSLSVRLTVFPFELPEPQGVFFGMYARYHGDEPGEQDRAYADMRRHGMTTVGHSGRLGAKIVKKGGRVLVRFDGESELEKVMAAYLKAQFPEPFVWLMGSDVLRWCLRQGPLDSSAFADAYRQVILRILEHGRRRKWPEIIFQPLDEPFEHTKRMPATKRCLQILKSIPGVRTEEDGPNGNPAMLSEIYDLCDVLVLHDGPVLRRGRYDADAWRRFLERTRRDGKSVWFYNIDLTAAHPEVMRWGYGFGLWFSGATGMIEWAYQFPVRKGREARAYKNERSIIFRFPAWGDEPGGPTIGWEAIREGVDDYKYLWLLQRRIADAKAAGAHKNIVEEAERFLAKLRAQTDFRAHEGSACQGDWTGRKSMSPTGEKIVSGSYKMANGWSFADYDAARRRIARYIEALQE